MCGTVCLVRQDVLVRSFPAKESLVENKTRAEAIAKSINFDRIRSFANGLETPCLVLDLAQINKSYDELEAAMPGARIFYAMKACPVNEVITLVAKRGGYFDAASRPEMEQLFRLGIDGSRISYGNTIKKECDIKFAFDHGVRIFTSDAYSDLDKLSRVAPGSLVNFRILTSGAGSDWALTEKFGVHPDMAYHLALYAQDLGLVPYGISFHVGSQQHNTWEWDRPLIEVRHLFDRLKQEGIELRCINTGGGFPAKLLKPTESTQTYGNAVMSYIKENFPDAALDIITEPGRSLVADGGVLVTEVMMVSKKSLDTEDRWVFTDIGRFGGLAETEKESIKYPILVPDREHESSEAWGEVILAGPTCDSYDIMYKEHRYRMPMNLEERERMYFLGTGAYTASYAAVGFNGFAPLSVHILPAK